jgi:hypothetical protein
MPGLRTTGDWNRAIEAGQWLPFGSRKAPSASFISTAGRWVDLSMAGGSPPANYYATTPLLAATLDKYRGIFHGDDKLPSYKQLAEITLQTPTAGLIGAYKLLDYLLYYPFIDLEDTDDQVMDNAVQLPRYSDGANVQAMLVVTNQTTSGGSFTFDYEDQDGNSQTSPTIFTDTTSAGAGVLATSAPGTVAGLGPFMPLIGGDTGIRRITAFRNLTPTGGLASLVLVRKLADLAIREVGSPSEFIFGGPGTKPPRITDGAFLGMIANCSASIASGLLLTDGIITWN